jgi:hypothetical protein
MCGVTTIWMEGGTHTHHHVQYTQPLAGVVVLLGGIRSRTVFWGGESFDGGSGGRGVCGVCVVCTIFWSGFFSRVCVGKVV